MRLARLPELDEVESNFLFMSRFFLLILHLFVLFMHRVFLFLLHIPFSSFSPPLPLHISQDFSSSFYCLHRLHSMCSQVRLWYKGYWQLGIKYRVQYIIMSDFLPSVLPSPSLLPSCTLGIALIQWKGTKLI